MKESKLEPPKSRSSPLKDALTGDPRDDPFRLRDLPADIVRAAIIDLVGRAVSFVLLSAAGGVVLLLWVGGEVPAWVAALLAVCAVAIAVFYRRRVWNLRMGERRREETIAELTAIADRVPELEAEVDALAEVAARVRGLDAELAELRPRAARLSELEAQMEDVAWAYERSESNAHHVCEMLSLLRQVLAGDAPGVTMEEFIARGVLAPARDLLNDSVNGGVRLSILQRTPDEHLIMLFSSGHRLEEQKRYRVRLVDSLARFALEEGVTQTWGDVTTDHRFKPDSSTGSFCSMVSVPIVIRQELTAVFNTTAPDPDAFDPADITYIAALGGIIEVALGASRQHPRAP